MYYQSKGVLSPIATRHSNRLNKDPKEEHKKKRRARPVGGREGLRDLLILNL